MKISPYFYFRGNASEAIAFYEKTFGGKAVIIKYKDIKQYDKNYVMPEGMEEQVMHANMNLGNEMMMFCDTPEKIILGEQVQIMVSLHSAEEVIRIFDILKESGSILMKPQKTFWSGCFASLKDKFGVNWLLMQE